MTPHSAQLLPVHQGQEEVVSAVDVRTFLHPFIISSPETFEGEGMVKCEVSFPKTATPYPALATLTLNRQQPVFSIQ
jgi:hypothetical protein